MKRYVERTDERLHIHATDVVEDLRIKTRTQREPYCLHTVHVVHTRNDLAWNPKKSLVHHFSEVGFTSGGVRKCCARSRLVGGKLVHGVLVVTAVLNIVVFT